MSESHARAHLDPTTEQARAFFMRGIQGPVVMLNLLRFRALADYSRAPELTPAAPISGAAAYQRYIEHTLPFLAEAGGELLFLGEGGAFFIGPEGECWDAALLVRQRPVSDFLSCATNEAYLRGLSHRTAALEDSRLLPLVECAALGRSTAEPARP